MIHPSAIIEPGACIADGVSVGAYSVIGVHVEIGEGTWIAPHVVVTGHTRIGRDNRIYPFCSIGEIPQDKKYDGEMTRLEIGDRNTIRESCTINRGTAQDRGVTRIGNDNWIMAYAHIAHDCDVGDNTVFSNNASLAGHVEVGDWAILGGFAGVHQFVRIGAHSFCGAGAIVLQDLPPFVTCYGNPAQPRGINSEGLRRRGFSSEAIAAVKRGYKALYRSGLTLDEAHSSIARMVNVQPELTVLADFLSVPGRGIIR